MYKRVAVLSVLNKYLRDADYCRQRMKKKKGKSPSLRGAGTVTFDTTRKLPMGSREIRKPQHIVA
jgi:predicted transcriptional regulator